MISSSFTSNLILLLFVIFILFLNFLDYYRLISHTLLTSKIYNIHLKHFKTMRRPFTMSSKNVSIFLWIWYWVFKERFHKWVDFTCVYRCFTEYPLTNILKISIIRFCYMFKLQVVVLCYTTTVSHFIFIFGRLCTFRCIFYILSII